MHSNIYNRLFAIGDIHGCFDQLMDMIGHRINLRKKDRLILLGDYIDRGSKSREVIDYIMEMQESGFDITPLTGNHEAMLLDSIEDEQNLPLWIYNGGMATMQSFGVVSPRELEPRYVRFFKDLQYYLSIGDYLFVHAGFNDNIQNPFSDKHSMIWECHDHYFHPLLKDKTIVHGHCIVPVVECRTKIEANPKNIGIDTGCVYKNLEGYGRLTSIELISGEIFMV